MQFIEDALVMSSRSLSRTTLTHIWFVCLLCFCLSKMGNSAGKENDINNLMHVTIVKDADLPKAQVELNNASGKYKTTFSYH